MDGGLFGDLPERVAAAVTRRVVDALDVDAIATRIDVDGIATRVDVDAIARRVDVDAIARRVDVDALARRLDMNALLSGVDVDELLARLDIDALVSRVDLDTLLAAVDLDGALARIDVNALLARLDVDALLDRLDVDALLARVDVDAIVARVDVDAALARVDIAALLQRADVADVIAESTGTFAGSALDVARRQLVGIDELLARGAFRLTGRDVAAIPKGPQGLGGDYAIEPGLPPRIRARSRAHVTGNYAGALSRLLAFLLDNGAAVLSLTAAAAVGSYAVRVVTGVHLDTGRTGPVGGAVLVAWTFLYWWLSLALAARTPGMSLLGLRAVRSDGRPLSPGRAALRVLLMPLSFAVLGLGLLGVVFDTRRRALHDLLSRTAVVYDWGDRPAEMPSPIAAWLHSHSPDETS